MADEYGSLWGSLHPTLIAVIAECDHQGQAKGGAEVRCVFVDEANLEATFNWQSPFEGAGPEARAPTLTAMLQSGTLQTLAERLSPSLGSALSGVTDAAQGRTGITKLNSTQVFSGMPPLKIQATILLRAWLSPKLEVEQPLDQLMGWALPQSLAAEGTMLTAIVDFIQSGDYSGINAVETALPSSAPALVSLTYKGRTFAPLVIETIGIPLTSPSDESGHFVQIQIPITFSTLRALDKSDWAALKR
jgi:hypothetical protein